MNSKPVMCAILFLVVSVGHMRAANPIAVINNGATLDGTQQDYTLKVNTKGAHIRPEDVIKHETQPDDRITVYRTPSPDSGLAIAVAELHHIQGNCAYCVWGTYIGGTGGSGTGPKQWTATYNRGPARILLELNGPGSDDNHVYIGRAGRRARITVTVAGVADTSSSLIGLSKQAGSGSGEVQFFKNGTNITSVSIRGQNSEQVEVEGTTAGHLVILGRSPYLQEGTVGGDVIAFWIMLPYGDPTKKGSANHTNEIAFWALDPGYLDFTCRAHYAGNGNDLRWTVENVGEIRATWEPHLQGDPYTGIGMTPGVTFSGMPQSNSSFGLKRIALSCAGATGNDTTYIEVFYPPMGRNNPGAPGETPPGDVKEEDLTE